MSRAPLRFLLLVLACWTGGRAFLLLSGRPAAEAPRVAARPDRSAPPGPPPTAAIAAAAAAARPTGAPPPSLIRPAPYKGGGAAPAFGLPAVATPMAPIAPPLPWPPRLQDEAGMEAGGPAGAPRGPLLSPPPPPGAARWSLAGWVLVRGGESGAALAPGGSLGGSQAGARLSHALGGGVSLNGRVHLPLRRPQGAEAAAGIDWRPFSGLPLNVLAERRQRLGGEGRSAFSLSLYGGFGHAVAPRLRLDAWGQAGLVGLGSRDLFADGAVRLARRVGPAEVGAGAWGAAQPGAARLDAGPSLSWRLPLRPANLRLQADWRFRLAGDAAPRSGPALTLATDF